MKFISRYSIQLSVFFLFLISCIFFYPVFKDGKLPLPLDALVGAHTPWIEVEWEGYPAGVPIKNQEITDAISQFYPWRSLVGHFWRAGKVPLWNQFMFSGTPFLASLHSAALYPFNLLYLFLSDSASWTILLFLQIFLAALFMFALLKTLGINKIISIIGAVSFAFSGYLISWLEFATGGQSGIWLPLLLLCELKIIKFNNYKYYFIIPFIYFFIYTAGDFQIPFYSVIVYWFVALYFFLLEKQKNIVIFKKYSGLLLSFILGILLALPQLVPAIELYKNSIRMADPYIKEYFYGLMDWSKITNFMWPDFYGNVVTRNYWARFGFHEYLAYTGILTVVYTVFSFLKKKSQEEKLFWLLLIFSLVFLFPTPLAFLPYSLHVPGLGTSSASRIIFITNFTLAVLGSYGLSKVQKKIDLLLLRKTVFYFLVITSGISLGLLFSVKYMSHDNLSSGIAMLQNAKVALKNMVPGTLILLVFFSYLIIINLKVFTSLHKLTYKVLLLLVVSLTTVDMLRFAWKNTPFSESRFLFPTTNTLDYLISRKETYRIAGSGLPLNYFMQYNLSSAEGYDSLYSLNNAQWFSLVNNGNTLKPNGRFGEISNYSSDLLDYANIKYIVDYKKTIGNKMLDDLGEYSGGLESKKFSIVNTEKKVAVFENKSVLPKVWLSKNYKVITNEDEYISNLLTPTSEPVILLYYPLNFEINNKTSLSYNIKNYKQQFNEISMSVNNSDNSLLFLSESYNPGWKAYVDGKNSNILKANYIFQALPLEKGEHEIKFIYQPTSFYYSVYIAIFTLILIIVWYKTQFFIINKNKDNLKK